MKKIMIATPMLGGTCHVQYMCAVMKFTQLAQIKGYDWLFRYSYHDVLIPRARNFLVHEFLKNDFTHLMFIDSDIVFDAEDIFKMAECDEDIVCGIYPKKAIHWNNVIEAVNQNIPIEELPLYAVDRVYNGLPDPKNIVKNGYELMEVMDAGTGFMMIKKEVFQQLANRVDSYTSTEKVNFIGERIKIYFDTSVDKSIDNYLSEDYHFCKSWRDIGGKVYAAPWIRLQHIGMNAFG
jgi:hypothetical protein